ncbi:MULTISPECIES: sigma 54-interacting transcriptional regulator [Clostridium]|uniref:HTH-type transcriptional regulatory protein TyrR n=1 Tax=Clostridium senegalense TaxID=1465809 RepID=A0A6M0H0P1_9CLOT|nr:MULTISPECIES: sigma 54-interacting transcriptional regulator [Clostridium]NEU03653.1 PAS domain S-box protein [Clostridium senegalense]
MNRYLRLEISTEDKIGITFKVLEKIYLANINLISLEVFPRKLYLKIEKIEYNEILKLMENIKIIEEVSEIKTIELLNYEQNEKRLRAIIDAVDDGILVIDKNYNIELFNSYCENIFNYKKDEVIGKSFEKVIKNNKSIINLIKHGNEYTNINTTSENNRGKACYITTGRAIWDDDEKVVGAVCSIKDMKKAIEMAKVVCHTRDGAFKDIVGTSKVIEQTKSVVELIAKGSSTVLIRGESGTGKELFAKAIHNLSGRKENPFVVINCAALPDSLMESELFGYEKGSFTGALNNGKDGLIKNADNGTLFLDEVGELSPLLQAKLLRVLQDGKVRKVGGTKEEKVNVRIICATNRNLEAMIKEKKFREDLYYRLNVIPLVIPPLRERKEDIPYLTKYFIEFLNHRINKNIKSADNEFINELLKYDWPGNIRELKNVIERAINLCSNDILTSECLLFDNKIFLQKINTKEVDNEKTLREMVEEVEKYTIVNALKKEKSIRAAARKLNVTHGTIINKIKKYNIKW